MRLVVSILLEIYFPWRATNTVLGRTLKNTVIPSLLILKAPMF